MGQKVNPHGARVGVILDWSTKWYAGKKDFSNNLVEDYKLRKMLKDKLESAGISHIDIQRTAAKSHRDRLHRQAGHRHRQGRRGRRGSEEGSRSLHRQARSAWTSCEIKNARHRRAAGGREHRPAAGEAHLLPPRHEADPGPRHEGAAPRESRPRCPAVWAARTSPAPKAITRVPSRCRPCARTSITALPKPRPPTAASASRCGFTRDRS